MRKSVVLPGVAVTFAAVASLLPLRGQEAVAQEPQAYVNVVDLEISPASMPRFLIFEVFNDSAAWDAHQKTTTYAKFLGITMMMIKTYAIRPFTSFALKKSIAPAPQADPPLILNIDEIDVVDGQIDKFKAAAMTHAVESVKDPGCREFDIVVSQTKSNHVLMLSAFDAAAALDAHQASDHYKAYMAATKSIVSMSTALPLSSVAVLTK